MIFIIKMNYLLNCVIYRTLPIPWTDCMAMDAECTFEWTRTSQSYRHNSWVQVVCKQRLRKIDGGSINIKNSAHRRTAKESLRKEIHRWALFSLFQRTADAAGVKYSQVHNAQ